MNEPAIVAGSSQKPRGYTLVDVALDNAAFRVDKDTQVRCLLYLIKHLAEFAAMPQGLEAEIIPVVHPHFRGKPTPSPAIGLYVKEGAHVALGDVPAPSDLILRLQAHVDDIGVQHLSELANEEDLPLMTWQDVLNRLQSSHSTSDNEPRSNTDL